MFSSRFSLTYRKSTLWCQPNQSTTNSFKNADIYFTWYKTDGIWTFCILILIIIILIFITSSYNIHSACWIVYINYTFLHFVHLLKSLCSPAYCFVSVLYLQQPKPLQLFSFSPKRKHKREKVASLKPLFFNSNLDIVTLCPPPHNINKAPPLCPEPTPHQGSRKQSLCSYIYIYI